VEKETRFQPVYGVVLTLSMLLAFRDHMKKEILISVLLLILVAYIFFISISIIKFESQKKTIKMKGIPRGINNTVKILLPAVEEEGEGTMAWLKLEINKGEGRTLLEIDDMLFWEDTQESIRTAKSLAEKITNIDASGYDIIYSFDANASKIEGPSAGPAMAVATAMILENKTINNSVVITGYLKEDGSIGRVADILAKAEAAKQSQVKLFLVPIGQKFQTKIENNKTCEQNILDTFCTTETVVRNVDIQEEVGIDVVEVGNISEALKYFVIN